MIKLMRLHKPVKPVKQRLLQRQQISNQVRNFLSI
jgi:hypothetical protein